MKINIFVLSVLLLGLGWPASSFAAEKSFADHCTKAFQKSGKCPEATCMMGCPQGQECSRPVCAPQKCPQISAADCPTEFCAIMTDCSDQKICHYKMVGEPPKCGNLAYAGQDVDCCPGFVRRCGVEFLDGSCEMVGKNSIYNIPICIPCGDGICGQFESRCNCPEDCRTIPPPKELLKKLKERKLPNNVILMP